MPLVIRRAPPKVDKAAEAAKAEAARKASAKAARKEAKRAALKKLQAASTLTQTAVVATDESQQSLQQALTESQEAMVDRADERLRRDPGFALLPPGPRSRRLAEHTSLPLDLVIGYLSQKDDSFLKVLQDINAPVPPGPGAAKLRVAITAFAAAIPGAAAKALLLKSPFYSDLTQ
jgi:hypothetical protein